MQAAEKKIERSSATVTDFGAHLEPVLRVRSGERFTVETQDNLFGRITSEEVLPSPEHLDILCTTPWTVNPVAGPICIEGLKAGDLLVVEIEEMLPTERSGARRLGPRLAAPHRSSRPPRWLLRTGRWGPYAGTLGPPQLAREDKSNQVRRSAPSEPGHNLSRH